ncbi:hypothetical protein FRC01_009266 [Tulasnella sp. 417]|nr:hypothetical protein FRC01_009266 [Tulasnella sp. 417]
MSFCTGMPGRCLKGFFQALVTRTGVLDHFHLSTDCPVVEYEAALAKWFESTPLLTEAELPRYYQTEVIVGTLGKLENLRSLATVWDNHLPYDEHGVHFQLSDDAFPCLTNLDIEGHLDYALATLQNSPQLSRIKCICLTSYRAPTPDDVLNLTTALASACPALDVVWLNFISSFIVRSVPTAVGVPSSNGVRGGGRHAAAAGDIDEMAEGWPNLRVLLLTRDPNHPSDDTSNLAVEYGLDISILAHMAQKLRNLTNLRLFLDVQHFTDFGGNLDPVYQFEKMIVLDVGCSPISTNAVSAVGLYLGSLMASPEA